MSSSLPGSTEDEVERTSSAPKPNSDSNSNKVLVGVCAMAKKATSKPMRQILARLNEYYGDYMEFVIFDEDTILHDQIENWPVVQVLIGFHSRGFPLEKAQAYVELREPYVPNDLEKQADLLDRTKVYTILESIQVDIPRYTVMWRNGSECEGTLVEHDDHIVINDHIFNKPFVEKPVSAEDHNIYMYYPSSAGGGSQRLFRKVNNRSSIYSTDSYVRQDGSYIYEEFMPTDGTDVKVYAVGPDYAHAEARKSPALDGKVERDASGKEIRYPIILTNREKAIARKIVWAFGQTVCGFDLLRASGKSYVCDVNGFSFVKSSTKYYEDSAKILGDMILQRFAPCLRIPWPSPSLCDPPLVSTTYGTMMELRCVLGVIRHGDRTPKQKLKMEVSHNKWHELFRKHANPSKPDGKAVEVKLKKPNQLQEVLTIVRYLLGEAEKRESQPKDGLCPSNGDIGEQKRKLEQVKSVLEMYGYFSGINRKVQLRYSDARVKNSSGTETELSANPNSGPKLLLIVKWGGELTPAGVLQAEELGKAFRCLYPGGQGHYGGDSRGLGFLRLHSTYRHDLKIYASEEGRVQMTAAAFTKGLLALEGELAPILVQMVKSANTDGLLDDDKDARRYQSGVKKYLHEYLQVDRVLDKEDFAKLNPAESKSLHNALQFIENPRRKCDRIWKVIGRMYDNIRMRRRDARLKSHSLYLTESWDLAEGRWAKLLKDFRHVKKDGHVVYDISKIPDIYDCIKYDLEHNVKFFNTDDMEELYICSKNMADVVVPQEYGIQKQEKMLIGQGTCTPLMKKLMCDLKACVKSEEGDDMLSTRLDPRASEGIQTPDRHVRTRLYFTSESHVHSLMNVIRWGGLVSDVNDKQWQRATNFLSSVTELNYMAQLVIMLYEDTTKDIAADDRFHVELHFSPGALPCIQTTHVAGLGYRPKSKENEQGQSGLSSNSSTVIGLGRFDEPKSTVRVRTLDDISESPEKQNESPMRRGLTKNAASAPVNIVAVGDRANRPITTEELARYSPSAWPRAMSPVSWSSEAGTSAPSDRENDEDQPNYNANVMAITEHTTSSRRNKLFYADLKHHTTSLLRSHEDCQHLSNLKQLISTAVINGLCSGGRGEDRSLGGPLLLSTAVIARGSSEPDLLSFSKLVQSHQDVSDISFYVPPLRSLETLHNQLSLRQVTEFLERATTQKTPAPSPPKTPRPQDLSRENSVIAISKKFTSTDQLQLSAAIVERLQKLDSEPS